MENKVNYEKTIALAEQESEFNKKKIKELERNFEERKDEYELKIRKIKEESS